MVSKVRLLSGESEIVMIAMQVHSVGVLAVEGPRRECWIGENDNG